jgi:hypothetical protein
MWKNALLTPVALLALMTSLPAQAPIGKGARFNWGSMKALVVPDSFQGVLIWAATTESGDAVLGRRRDFSDFFDPDSAASWALEGEQFLDAKLPHPVDTAQWRFTSVLTGRGGVSLFMGFRWTGKSWDKDPYVYFAHGDDRPLILHAFPSIARAFFEGVADQAPAGQVRARPVIRLDTLANLTVATVSAPDLVDERRHMQYPEGLRQKAVSGDVWAAFVVDTDGTVDLASVHVLYADDPGFTKAVRDYLAGARYQPSRVGGRPLRSWVRQAFMFRLIERPPPS